jgi:hypothetical protein
LNAFTHWIRLFLLGSGFILSGCPDPCTTEVKRELSSPDGRFKAIVFTRDCGAVTTTVVHLSIITKGEAMPKAGNVLSGDWGHNSNVGLDMQIGWVSNSRLKVIYDDRLKTSLKTSVVSGIDVEFAPR